MRLNERLGIAHPDEDLPSHWLIDAGAAHPPYLNSLPVEVEVVVIGGGVLGVATTYWLACSGVVVLLLDSYMLGCGASGRNAGLLLCGSNPLERPDLIESVLRDEAIEAEYNVCGHLALASSPIVADRMREEVASRSSSAAPVYFLDRSECESLLGMTVSSTFCGGRWFPGGASIHPVRFVRGIAAAANRHGASIGVMTEAQAVLQEPSGDCVTVKTTQGTVRARRVVITCNSRTASLLPGLESLFRPTRGQVLCTSPLCSVFRAGMAVDWGTLYWRQAQDGAIVLGGYCNLDAVGEATTQEGLNPKIQAALDRFLPEAFPNFPNFSVARRWSGIMDETIDGKPILGKWPSETGVWVAAGFGGHGLPPAIGFGRELANSVLGDKLSSLLEPFNPARFQTPALTPCQVPS